MVGAAVAVGNGVAVAVGSGVAVAVGEGLAVAVGVGLGVGDACLLALSKALEVEFELTPGMQALKANRHKMLIADLALI